MSITCYWLELGTMSKHNIYYDWFLIKYNTKLVLCCDTWRWHMQFLLAHRTPLRHHVSSIFMHRHCPHCLASWETFEAIESTYYSFLKDLRKLHFVFISHMNQMIHLQRKYCLVHMFICSPKSVEISIWQQMMSNLVEFHMRQVRRVENSDRRCWPIIGK